MNCKRDLGDYDKQSFKVAGEFDSIPDISRLVHLLRIRDWEGADNEWEKIKPTVAASLFLGRAYQLAFGAELQEAGCTCNQVLTIYADEDNTIGCSRCEVTLHAEDIAETQ